MSKPDPRETKSDRDVLDNLGDMIGGRIKKGMSKLEEIIADAKKDKEEHQDAKFMAYVKIFMDDPSVAAVTPSSRFLVNRTVKAMNLENAKTIVEYGAARGVMTRRILEKMRPDATLLAIEFNEALFAELKKLSDPRLTPLHGDVREIDKILARQGLDGADVIVSGVPFAFFSGRGRHELLTKTSELLRPGGRFVAYQVTTHLIPMLKDYFSDVDIQFEVRNMPPHFIFTALK
ncbi:MAG: methyltransferase domain-containing protein [Elusimicrobia bacterium]|nr:methyltransferase domain-containing protein [Elusimicrobiota bacterium]